MKKILSAVLVLAMLLGLGAGASAVSLPELKAAKPIAAASASIDEIHDSSLYFALMWTGKSYYRIDFLSYTESAYKIGKAKEALQIASDDITGRMDGSAENKAIEAFWNNDAAVEKAYKDGTLAKKSALLFADCLDAFEDELDKLAKEYFKPEALAYADSALEEAIWLRLVIYLEACGDLTSEKRYEMGEKATALAYKYADKLSMYVLWKEEGNWAELTALHKDYLKDLKAIYAEYGITELPARPGKDPGKDPTKPNPDPQPSVIARIWQAIVKYVFFGWLIALFR